jgi:hypothetical protein
VSRPPAAFAFPNNQELDLLWEFHVSHRTGDDRQFCVDDGMNKT